MSKKRLKTNGKRLIKLPRSVKRLFPNVISVTDSKSVIEVSVTKKDCDNATKQNPIECALARATKRAYAADGVIIGMNTSYLIRGNEAIRFATPESVSREIVSFDRNNDFEPGHYYLRPKSPTERFGQKRSYHAGGNIKTAKRKIHMSGRVRILAKGAE